MITWDADKRKRNIRKHRGVDLTLAERFDFVTTVIENDGRAPASSGSGP